MFKLYPESKEAKQVLAGGAGVIVPGGGSNGSGGKSQNSGDKA
jgi:hypothetical protein